jgi:hypothetical protein
MLEEISDTLNEVRKAIAAGESDLMRSLAGKLTEEQALELLTNKEYFVKYLNNNSNYGYYRTAEFVKILLSKHRAIANNVIGANLCERTTLILLSSGYYSDVKVFDELAINTKGSIQVYAAQHCSIDILKQLKSCSDKRVRKVYYSRMGAVESLDDMLEDSTASFRGDGVRLAPYGYHKLKNMVNEISFYPFAALINKLSDEDIPLVLANRNIKKNKWIANSLQNRMNKE